MITNDQAITFALQTFAFGVLVGAILTVVLAFDLWSLWKMGKELRAWLARRFPR